MFANYVQFSNESFIHFQAFLTYVYVDYISIVGERLAKRLKNSLFVSVMEQDLQFFDKNRTGEIIDR